MASLHQCSKSLFQSRRLSHKVDRASGQRTIGVIRKTRASADQSSTVHSQVPQRIPDIESGNGSIIVQESPLPYSPIKVPSNGSATAAASNGSAAKGNGAVRSSSKAGEGERGDSTGQTKTISRRRSSRSFIVGKEPDVPPSIHEYFKACNSLEGFNFGPPRFFCPLDAKPEADLDETLPKLFFVPGIEGTGMGLILHHKPLSRIFELSCLNAPLSDRTSFLGIVEIVERTVHEEHRSNPGRAIFLMGESFGAVVSLAVAERNPGLPLTLILVNPATSFERSRFQPLIPIIPLIPDALYPALPVLLSFSLGNPVKMASNGIPLNADPVQRVLEIRNNLVNLIPTIPEVANLLPKATLEWKLKLLDEGVTYMERLLPQVSYPTLILASGNDQLVPSAEESKRLASLIQANGCKVVLREVADSGHTLLLEGDFDLTGAIKGSSLYRRTGNPRENPVLDSFPSPTVEDLHRVRASSLDGFLRFFCSPVFFSTEEDGRVVQGFSGLPLTHQQHISHPHSDSQPQRPIIFVGNHQTYAQELTVVVGEVLEKTGVLMRGLAHPVAMGMMMGQLGSDWGMGYMFRTFGAVPVSPYSMGKLLANGEAVLLYPGGAREACRNKGEEYKLIWPEKEEIIRMAIRFNAIIVPFAGVGVDDSFEYVYGGDELLSNPVIGPRLREEMDKVMVRVRDDPALEDFGPSVVFPKKLNRLYFVFRKPIFTEGLDVKDKELARRMYGHVKSEVEGGIEYLLNKREEDPYKDLGLRLLYEASWGGKRQAPTFSP